jgi:putative membrane protein
VRSSAARLGPALAAILALSAWQRPALVLLALLPLLAVAGALERRFHRYALDGDMLFVARGVWRRRLWLVPLANVQSLSLSRGPIQRWLGLSTLAIDTPGASLINSPRIVDLRGKAAQELAGEISRRRRISAERSGLNRHRHDGSVNGAQASGRKSGTER